MADGPAGDVFDDLGRLAPSLLCGRPRALVLLVAVALAVVVTVAGIVGSDPYDGALRGIVDAIACLGCYGLLGRYIGLRRS
ncbi:MAG: hypothetical protein JO372_14685 [Solirubrobacterales bacterium]|nr:hypothetical protein [Solirubrobacterales bacterium]